jgi:hypothetical protein
VRYGYVQSNKSIDPKLSAVGQAKNVQQMYGKSHKEITAAAILDLGRLIKNPKKTRGHIAKRRLCAK